MVAMVHQWGFFAFSGVKFKENMCIDSVLAVIMHSAMVAMVHQWVRANTALREAKGATMSALYIVSLQAVVVLRALPQVLLSGTVPPRCISSSATRQAIIAPGLLS